MRRKNRIFLKKNAIRRINPLQKQKISAQPCPFDVKKQTRIPKEFADYERKLIFYV